MSIILEPDTPEVRKKLQNLARHQMIVRLEKDIMMDLQICEIEGWDKTEYITLLREILINLGGRTC